VDQGHDGGRAPAAVRWIARAEIAVVGAILLVSLLITLYAIVARNLGHSTGDWALKLPELMLVWMTFLGMGALVTERGHVAADMFVQRLTPRTQRIAHTVAAAVAAAILGLILAGAVSIVGQQIEIGATDQELFEVPSAIILAGLPLGLALTIAHLFADIYAIWRPAAPPTP
jgi:TRAP-type C4-dicarboxylate transport system permease small subunit